MRKGTILYVGNFELPDKGAAANRVVSNGKIFTKLGYRVAYLGITKAGRFQGICPLDKERHMYEEAYPQGSKEWFLHMWSTENIQEMQSIYPDLCMVILYNVPFLLLCRVKQLFGKTEVKVVYDCTEWTGVTDGSLPKRIVKWMDESFVRNGIGQVADGLIVVSQTMERHYAGSKALLRLPPLIDLDDVIWHQEMKKTDDKFEFLFAGILDGNKDSLDKIVDAFVRLENTESILRIIGVTKEEFLKYYPSMEQQLEKESERVVFMGTLSHAETIRYVLGCDCYIFIRQSDRRNNAGFPTKFVESYSCGCSIIATDISDIRQYTTNEDNIHLLQAADVQEVKRAMAAVMQKSHNEEGHCLNMKFHYENYLDETKDWLEKAGI